MRIVTEADKMALELLAESYSEYRKAIEIIKEKGFTYTIRDRSGNEIIKPRPENLIKDKAMGRMRALLTEFGLTPSSRARVNSQEKIEINDIENLID
jgi:P27 family predicted phage terminase small subunit